MTGSNGRVQKMLIYVGAPKCGSSWLYEFLKAHPSTTVAKSKELFFFDRFYDRGMQWYWSQFESNDKTKYCCDISHDYMFSPEAVERMTKELQESAYILSFLRNPIDKMFSAYLFKVRNGLTQNSFWEDFQENEQRITESVSYAQHVLRLQSSLAENHQLKFMLYEQLNESASTFSQSILEWLQLEPLEGYDAEKKVLPASRPRARILSVLLKKAALGARSVGFNRLVAAVKNSALTKLLYKEYADNDKPVLDVGLRLKLVAKLREDVEKLDVLIPEAGIRKYWPEFF